MSSLDFSSAVARPFFRDLKNLFRRPARLQIAALCYRMHEDERQVLLVTSRSSRRWILPKGWPIMKRKAHKTAVVEAFEEAGVIGKASKKPYDTYMSYKGHGGGLKIRTEVLVYLLRADDQTKDFPEAGQREIRWLSIEQAIEQTDEPGLIRVLQRFNRETAK
ncbi:NUDIX hydrolase [Roseibium sp.]|uniref:NUDIX hydrolase n=1 Tax=Roseibium sp. TaxID=1936156 RepID=UPI003A9791B4